MIIIKELEVFDMGDKSPKKREQKKKKADKKPSASLASVAIGNPANKGK